LVDELESVLQRDCDERTAIRGSKLSELAAPPPANGRVIPERPR